MRQMSFVTANDGLMELQGIHFVSISMRVATMDLQVHSFWSENETQYMQNNLAEYGGKKVDEECRAGVYIGQI